MPVISVKKHITGDISVPKGTPLAHRIAFTRLLRKLACAARDCRQKWHVNSGYRSFAEQTVLYERWLHGTGNLAARPGTSNHEGGKAVDVSVPGGQPVGASKRRVEALRKYGLCLPVRGEAWHVEIGNRFV